VKASCEGARMVMSFALLRVSRSCGFMLTREVRFERLGCEDSVVVRFEGCHFEIALW
jgi:hypothetical protein